MNRFETMLAPPTLSGKDMAVHVKMQTAIPREEAKTLRMELFVPKVRLYDELTTLRFSKPGSDETNAAYEQFCHALTNAWGEPIPYRFFKAEFERMMAYMGIPTDGSKAVRASLLRQGLDALQDPWRVQAYAALCARIAEHSETQDAAHARPAWDMAFTLYQRFFDSANVEESSTYRTQTEEKLRNDTIEAWNGFLRQLAEGIYQRLKTYTQEKKADSVSACVSVLSLESVRQIDGGIYEKALQETFLPYMNALSSARTLDEAAKLYDKIPVGIQRQDTRKEATRAMLAAMSGELKRLRDDGGSVCDVMEWSETLKTRSLYEHGSPLVKKAASDFYEACADYVRDVINGSKHDRAGYADALTAILPEDIVIANSGKEALHRKELLGYCTSEKIAHEYGEKMNYIHSCGEAEDMGREILRIIYHTMESCYVKEECSGNSNIIDTRAHILKRLIIIVQESNMSLSYTKALFEPFDDNFSIDDDTVTTIGAFKKMLAPPPPPPRRSPSPGLQAIFDYANAGEVTWERLSALKRVLEYALQHPEADIDENIQGNYMLLALRFCKECLIDALNRRMSGNETPVCQPMMELAASFLPEAFTLPDASGREIPLTRIEKEQHLNIDKTMRNRVSDILGVTIHASGKPRTSDVPAELGMTLFVKAFGSALVGLLFIGIVYYALSAIFHEPPTALRYFMLILKIGLMFQIPYAFSEYCSKELSRCLEDGDCPASYLGKLERRCGFWKGLHTTINTLHTVALLYWSGRFFWPDFFSVAIQDSYVVGALFGVIVLYCFFGFLAAQKQDTLGDWNYSIYGFLR